MRGPGRPHRAPLSPQAGLHATSDDEKLVPYVLITLAGVGYGARVVVHAIIRPSVPQAIVGDSPAAIMSWSFPVGLLRPRVTCAKSTIQPPTQGSRVGGVDGA
jgi:hypothetical protein